MTNAPSALPHDVDALQVVLFRAGERDPSRTNPPPLQRKRNLSLASEVFASQRTLVSTRHRSGEHDVAERHNEHQP